uniref:Ankyrin repeat and socs box protein 2-like protein n=1 Tax=Triatoma infestans TaxID=30076 RepID=A0A161MT24_TRIIF
MYIKNDRSWNGTETNTFAYLMELSTDHSVAFDALREESVDETLDLVRRLVKSKRRPASLKRLARSSFRSYLHKETASKPSEFLPTVRHIDAPKSVIGFLMYNDI